MTLRDWLVEHPPPDAAFTQTVAGVAERVATGEPFLPAVRELLDEFSLLGTDVQRLRALEEWPGPTGDPRHDAYLWRRSRSVIGRSISGSRPGALRRDILRVGRSGETVLCSSCALVVE